MVDINKHYSRLFLSRNLLKTEALQRNRLEATRPVIEFLLCAAEVTKTDKPYFKITEIRQLLTHYQLPHHGNSVYQAAKILREKGFIMPLTPGRQWFQPRNWTITAAGMGVIFGFEQSCSQLVNH